VNSALAQRAADSLRQRHENALVEGQRSQAQRYVTQGFEALGTKDFAGASNFLRLALSLCPEDPEIQTKCKEGLATAATALADGYWKQALNEEGQERWIDAALSFAKVCAGRPNDGLAHERVAYATIKAGANPRRSVEYARRAVELKPTSIDFRLTLARAYAAAGLEKSAQGELDRVLELSPNDAKTKSLVASVRSSFSALKPAGADTSGAPSIVVPSAETDRRSSPPKKGA
jgi:tetratricopeptide (TPR) repeat protein